MASRRGDIFVKKKFNAVNIGVIQKTSLQTFFRQGLTTLNKEELQQNEPQNNPK